MDAQIHRWYSDVLTDKSRKVWPPRNLPYFSPSSANSCPRELYEKLRKSKRDVRVTPPHQGRWTSIGTAIGDVIQRELLFAEKHLPGSRFRFERNERSEPMFEDFAKVNRTIEHNGQTFALFGTCDGIMRYVAESGEIIRIGLEVKSKQTTAATTSEFSQRNGPKEDHVKQTICYSVMYSAADEPIDYYVILYVNASKKSWEMTAEEYRKNPDIAVHCIEITDEMRTEVLDRFAGIVKAAAQAETPPLDIMKWTFNGFKVACAAGLSASELADIERQVAAVQRSNLKDFVKRQYADALADIKRLRGEVV
ncbi:hypothetical protein ACFOQM_23525 [Paenibacillus sp. GCM10012307]|uniref:Uncharacterized protein n=1 Tax=Paenibacillus roseus TaxID=2798579 RepID=A0A934MTG1_9BACL|nr:hypothetical protein [Paenibacillus roseus]